MIMYAIHVSTNHVSLEFIEVRFFIMQYNNAVVVSNRINSSGIKVLDNDGYTNKWVSNVADT